MSSVEGQHTVTSVESAASERERRLQQRQERDRVHRQSESAEQREERLRRWRVRDRARWATQTAEQRELGLQQRPNQLSSEITEQGDARLQQMSSDVNVIDLAVRRQSNGRLGYVK